MQDSIDPYGSVPETQPAPEEPTVAVETPAPAAAVVADEEPRGRRSSAGKRGLGGVWITLAVIVALAILGAVGWYGYQAKVTRSAASEKLAEATGLIESADEVVLQIDEVVRAEVTANVGRKAAEAKTKFDGASADLDSAITMLEQAKPDLSEAEVLRANALANSAKARITMLGQASPILDANVAAGSAIDPAQEAWTLMLDAEKIADESVKEYNKLTKDAVSKSATLTVSAEAKFKESRLKFDEAHKAFGAAGLDVYLTYIDQKLAALALSRQADTSFVAGNNAQANEYSNQYNVKDKQVIELAKKLPASPSAVIADAYEKQAGEATKAYFQAREEATSADDELRALSE
ncbi:MAG: hypothetical protein Q7V14_00315 [Coriobacteriia bacterium]|nr:hypothetical protein [Coriobacteriia bacterium]